MTAKILGLILSSIALSSTGQLLMKLGMTSGRVQAALASTPFEALIAVVTTLPVFGGLCCYGLASVLWLLVLARIDLALAYPFVGLNFLLIMLAGYFFPGEHLGLLRIFGATLVGFGIYLVTIS